MSERPPRVAVPPGACDTHMHFYDESVPAAQGGPPLPGDFTVPMYRELQKRLGLERVIVVQPNAYQTDNRVTLDAIRALGPNAKGVGVVGPSATASRNRATLNGRHLCAAHFPVAGWRDRFRQDGSGYGAGAPARLAREYPTGRP